MNDARRKKIQRAQMLIGEAKGILEVAAERNVRFTPKSGYWLSGS